MRAILRQRTVAVTEQLDEVVLRRDVRIDLAVVVRDRTGEVAARARPRVRALHEQVLREAMLERHLERFVRALNADAILPEDF